MPTKLVGRPRIDDGRHVRTMAVRISHDTLGRFREIVEQGDEGLSMAQTLGRLVEQFVEQRSKS